MEDKKAELFYCGKELFSSRGFKDTNVSDITKMAGMGVGTFYNYYSSKEQLFMEIFMKENEKLKKSFEESIDADTEPEEAIMKMLSANYAGINSNPILKEWHNKDLIGKLEKLFVEQGGVKSISELMNGSTLELIRKWKAEGKIRPDLDDHLILAILFAVPYIDLHKDEIGLQFFPQIMYYITEFIMKGLTNYKK